MIFATCLLLSASAMVAEPAPPAQAPAIDPAILEMTYDAFVAIEETPPTDQLLRPAVLERPAHGPLIDASAGTGWIG